MTEEARLSITHRRPTLVLDGRFNLDLKTGTKVQLEAEIEIDRIDPIFDEDGTQRQVFEFLVNKVELSKGAVI